MQLRTVCDKRLYVPITSGSFEAKISIDIKLTFFFFYNNVSIIEDNIFATDFLRFFQSFQKNVKSRVFWNLKKNEKYVFSNTGYSLPTTTQIALGNRYVNLQLGIQWPSPVSLGTSYNDLFQRVPLVVWIHRTWSVYFGRWWCWRWSCWAEHVGSQDSAKYTTSYWRHHSCCIDVDAITLTSNWWHAPAAETRRSLAYRT